MSRNRIQRQVALMFLVIGVFVIASSVSASDMEINDDRCAAASPMDLNGSLRGFGEAIGEPLLVKLEIPSAGLLSLDVSVPGTARTMPKLGLARLACGARGANAEPVVLERSATHLVLASRRPGSLVFRVASQDPSLPLRELTLRSGFSPDTAGPLVDKGGEDEEIIEIDADPLIYSVPAGSRSLQSRLDELCRGETDDHGDSFTCATFLIPGRDTVGEIRNGWGDDGDVFRFVVGGVGGPKLWTVEIEAIGPIDTFGGLYDQFGTRLEKGDGGGDGDNFRIVRVLPAGSYYIRVESRHGAEGPYRLSVAASPW